MRKYLDDSAVKVDEAGLRQIIEEQCRWTCRQIISQNLKISLPAISLPKGENLYIKQFTTWAIQDRLNFRIAIFGETILLISQCKVFVDMQQQLLPFIQRLTITGEIQGSSRLQELKEAKQSLIEILFMPDKANGNSCLQALKEVIGEFKNYFRRFWEHLRWRKLLTVDVDDPFSDLATTAEEFTRALNDAVRFLELENCPKFQYTARLTKSRLELHEINASSDDIETLLNCLACNDYPTLTGILLIILHQISKDVEEELVKVLPRFITIQGTKGENN